jgi:hypothetical protein
LLPTIRSDCCGQTSTIATIDHPTRTVDHPTG